MALKNETYTELETLLKKAYAVQAAMAVIEWDNETAAPKEAGELTSEMVGRLSGVYYEIMAGDDMGKLLKTCEKKQESQKNGQKDGSKASEKNMEELIKVRMVEEAKKERELLTCVPQEEFEEYTKLTSAAGKTWAKAKEQSDFSIFAPTLKKIIDFRKKLASYRQKDGQTIYEVMLGEFEESFPENKLDEFFDIIRKELVPFLDEIKKSGKAVDNSFLKGGYSEEKQRELAVMIAEYIGFDFDRGVLSVSAHPFTTSFHNKDVRMTTHYDDWADHSLFSVIHEGGHALYELGIDDRLTQTLLGQGASMAMHESQSRFVENMIGRSEAFWVPIYGKVQKLFPKQLGNVSLKEFTAAINRVEPGLIRTNADELTYSLHIMIRYELEKALMEEKIEVEDLEKVWADKYEEYLGIRPENAAEGVLQDIHWSQGSFGYFPSYALGSAFAAQIYEHMKEEIDVDSLLKEGKIGEVTDYLKEHIHRFGRLKDSRQILRDTTGEDFNPHYYVKYLKEKYGKLYGVSI